jgi:hypothetical protein
MLVEKKAKEATVVAIKLITGEEIIAHKILEDGDRVRVRDPLAMVMAENPDNPQQTRVMFTPWMVAGETQDVSINKSNIIAITNARTDAAEQYAQAVAS